MRRGSLVRGSGVGRCTARDKYVHTAREAFTGKEMGGTGWERGRDGDGVGQGRGIGKVQISRQKNRG